MGPDIWGGDISLHLDKLDNLETLNPLRLSFQRSLSLLYDKTNLLSLKTCNCPHIQGAVAVWVQEGLGSYSMFKVKRGSGEEIPLVQGKEQWLRFAGAAVKRYPTSKVSEIQVKQ